MAPPTTAATPARTAFLVIIGPAALSDSVGVEAASGVASEAVAEAEAEPESVFSASEAVLVGLETPVVEAGEELSPSLLAPAVTVTGMMTASYSDLLPLVETTVEELSEKVPDEALMVMVQVTA